MRASAPLKELTSALELHNMLDPSNFSRATNRKYSPVLMHKISTSQMPTTPWNSTAQEMEDADLGQLKTMVRSSSNILCKVE
jgi:hypothetical protein